MTIVFKSKRDWWIVALIWTGVFACTIAALAQFSSPSTLYLRELNVFILIAVSTFMLWVLYGTDYTLTNYHLLIRCGPFRYQVPLEEIDSVTPSRNPLSSPACSLDRLLIRWDEDSKKILISPAQKAEFLRELDKRCAQLRSDDGGLVRE